MTRHDQSVTRLLSVTVTALLLLGAVHAQAMDEVNPVGPGAPNGQRNPAGTGPQRDPSKLTPMRRTTSAERTAAALRAAERRKSAESNGLLAPKAKAEHQLRLEQESQRQQLRHEEQLKQAPRGDGPSALNGAAATLLNLALGQVGTIDLYAGPNFANSKSPIAHCAGPGSNGAELCQQDSDCTGYLLPFMIGPDVFASGATCTGPVVPGTGIKKFVDTLPPLCALGTNNLGNCIPIAVPDTTRYPGSDYYELGLKDYTTQFHTNLPNKTKVRGYYQKNVAPTDPAARNNYLGPLILAHTNVPVRLHFSNDLNTSAAGGNLYVPMDSTLAGAGLGPDGLPYTENRATIHLHGGNTPWISDGTQHQWTVPALETTTHKKGLSVGYVPDMWYDAAGVEIAACKGQLTCGITGATNNPGDGKLTFFYTNQQSGRLMFYHDHAYGVTRLNVYSGEAAGYLLVNATDEDRLAAAGIPGTLGAAFDVTHVVPMVIQDKTFVPPPFQLSVQDPTWDTVKWSGEDGLWLPHVYTPNQWPGNPDNSNTNPFGRWDYGPWFWPVQTSLVEVDHNGVAFNRPLFAACTTAAAVSVANPAGDTTCPTTPNPSLVPEAFLDTPVVNGTAYPTVTVDPVAYRFQMLNAANERNFNLSLWVADASGTEVALVPATPHGATTTPPLCGNAPALSAVTGTPNGPDILAPTCWPREWPVDGRQGGVPDPAFAGPKWLQLGTEGGLLPVPAVIPPRPVVYEQNKRNIVVLNVASKSLFMGPAERADVVVDFSAYAGKTLILYNDAPAPVPAGDPRQDYYTGGPDFTTSGGAPTPLPGYGPNTRTVMQIKVRATGPVQAPISLPAVATALATSFVASQPAPIVPESAYNTVYNPPVAYTDVYLPIDGMNLTFTPIGEAGPKTITFGNKALHELFTSSYGRMNSLLGVEIPNTNWLNQTTIPFSNFDPPTEYLPDGQQQIWKITHNGVDTHTIHFHLFSVQIVNRVGWDGQIRPPDANELGWKESVRMNPLEDVILALRPFKQTLNWPLPDMVRPLDVDRPIGTASQFTGVDIYNRPIAVTNKQTNFGQEYVWHCHLLGHEEEDMLRAEILVVPPEAPTALTAARIGATTQVRLTWNDPSRSALGYTVQRDRNAAFTTVPAATFAVPKAAVQPGGVVYTNSGAANSGVWFYRVRAEKKLSSAADPAVTYSAPSAWSATVQVGNAPRASVSPASLVFAEQALGVASAAQVVTVRNTGTAILNLVSRSMTGPNASAFSSNAGPTLPCGGTLAAGGTCNYQVLFQPSMAGANTASFVIVTNDTLNPNLTVTLTGSGIGAAVTMVPAALTFVDQGLGTTSAPQVVTLTNNGTTALTLTSPLLGGTSPTQFGATTTCLASLAPATSCTVSATFAPTVAGTLDATLSFTTNDLLNPTLVISMIGTGIPKATGVTLTPNRPSPNTTGLAVKFTAKGTGPLTIPAGAYQYQFSLNGTAVQAWGAAATWTLPSAQLTGTYNVSVDVRTSSAAVTPDATATVAYLNTEPAATGVTLTPSLSSPQYLGTPITFTGLGQGSYGYQYRFDFYNGTTWTTVQDFSSTSSWTLPGTTPAGSYWVAVLVRTNTSAFYDAIAYAKFEVLSPSLPPATGLTITQDVASPITLGTPVTFTATGQGSSGYQYRFDFYNGTSWTIVQDFSSSGTWALPTSTPVGSYWLAVMVRTNANVVYDVISYAKFAVANPPLPPATGVAITPSPSSPATFGTPVTFTAVGQGSSAYQYRFDFFDGAAWSIAQDFSATGTWTLPGSTPAGSYWVAVLVRSNPNVFYDVIGYASYTINP